MKREIDVKPKALHDLLHYFWYIKHDNPSAAERLVHAFDETIISLSEMPGMGAQRQFDKLFLQGLRSYPIKGFRNHLIFYKYADQRVEILRVIHGARDLEKALGADYR